MSEQVPDTISFEQFRAQLAESGGQLPLPEYSPDHPQELAVLIGYLLRSQEHPPTWRHLISAALSLAASAEAALHLHRNRLTRDETIDNTEARIKLCRYAAAHADMATAVACLGSAMEFLEKPVADPENIKPEDLISKLFANSLGFTPKELIAKYSIEDPSDS